MLFCVAMRGLAKDAILILPLVAVPLWAACLGSSGPAEVRLDLGPGDGPYVSGLASEYEIEAAGSSQWSRQNSRVVLPLTVRGGPVTLGYRYSRPLSDLADVQVFLADSLVDHFTANPSSEERRVQLAALPTTPLVARFYVPHAGRTGWGLRLEWVSVEAGAGARIALRGFAILRPALLVLILFAALRIAGWTAASSALWCSPWALAFAVGLVRNPWLVHRLITGLPEWLALFGLGGAFVAAWLRRHGRIDEDSARMIVALAMAAFLARAMLFNDPRYYYSDLRIHAKLAETVRQAGWDFLRAPAHYILEHKAWSRVIDGRTFAFPYTPAFHALFAPMPLSYDGLITALKLGACLSTVVPIVVLWSLCRAWGASTLGVVLLLFVPIYVHHLGLAYVAALFGHAVDMIFVAWLARHLARLPEAGAFAAGALLVAACQLAYVTAVIVLPIFLGVLAACVLVQERDAAGWRRVAAVLGIGAAGSVLAVVIFYRDFSPLISSALSHAASGAPVAASDDAPKQAYVAVLWRFTRKYFDYLWTPLALAGLALLARRGPGRPVILAWGITYLLLLFGRAHLPFVFQHPHDALFVTPLVCLGAGRAVDEVSRRGAIGRWAAAALLAGLVLQGLLVQWQEWGRHLKAGP